MRSLLVMAFMMISIVAQAENVNCRVSAGLDSNTISMQSGHHFDVSEGVVKCNLTVGPSSAVLSIRDANTDTLLAYTFGDVSNGNKLFVAVPKLGSCECQSQTQE